MSRTVTTDKQLDLHMVPPAPLDTLIKKAFKMEVRTYRCDQAGCNATERKTTVRMVAAPHILVMRFVRFKDESEKLVDHIHFNEYQDLTRYQEGASRLRYRLRSVVLHRGSLESGHYVTIVRDPRDAWMVLNDNKPPRPIERAQFNVEGGKITSYILFWEKEERGRSLSKQADKESYMEQAQKL